jgi:hypothetical protein
MSGIGALSGIALECRDPTQLAAFYSQLTAWPVVHADPDWYSVGESEQTGVPSVVPAGAGPPTTDVA